MKSPAPSADSITRTRRLYARVALAASLLTLIVIAASAFIRHTQAGLSCIDWPACYAAIDTQGDAQQSTSVFIARLAHRFAATAALVFVIGLWLSARGRGEHFKQQRVLALAALLVAAALGVLGVATPGASVPAVPLGNLIGGYLMLALLAASIGATAVDKDTVIAAQTAGAPYTRFALGLIALAFMQASFGALIGTRFALTACPELLRCTDFVADGATFAAALDPFQQLAIADGHVVPPAGAAGLHFVHRLLGVAVAALSLVLGYALRSTDRRAARVLSVLAVATPSLGTAAIVAMPSLALTVLHNAAAAVLIATLAYVAARRTIGSIRGQTRSRTALLAVISSDTRTPSSSSRS